MLLPRNLIQFYTHSVLCSTLTSIIVIDTMWTHTFESGATAKRLSERSHASRHSRPIKRPGASRGMVIVKTFFFSFFQTFEKSKKKGRGESKKQVNREAGKLGEKVENNQERKIEKDGSRWNVVDGTASLVPKSAQKF